MLNLNEQILPIDRAIAKELVSQNGSENGFLFACYLSKSAREGHLCVKIDGDEVLPDPELMIGVEREKIVKGFSDLPEHIIGSNGDASKPLYKQGSCIYFQKNWLHERSFHEHLQRLLQREPEITFAPDLDDLWNKGILLQEQFQAIKKSLQNSFTIISGGPGTGKTYTAGLIIKTLWDSLNEEQKSKMHIILAAPTGKAASNLQKSISKAISGAGDFPHLQAQTLHALLGKKKKSSLTHLRADFILVDECSMIDASIMSRLLSSIKSGARVVFLGDPHQLPPVESGALFADMNEALKEHSVHLKQCLRSDLKGILDFASKVKEGDAASALGLLASAESKSGLHLLETEETAIPRLKKFFLEYAMNRFPSPQLSDASPAELIEMFNQFRLLSPMRKGPFGVDELNRLFLEHFKSQIMPGKGFVAPIMLTNNDYRLELFNGEVGVLVRPPQGEEYLLIQSATGVRKIPGILIPRYEFSYCLSVHKSQGSEFDQVLALFPEGSDVFGREVLYTAATRARKLLEVFGTRDTLAATITRKVKRISGM